MHGQLGEANVHRGHADLADGDAAQGAAAGNVRAVVIVLAVDPRSLAHRAHDGGAEAVGAVAQVGIELDDDAAAHLGGVAAVGQLWVVGVLGVGVVGTDQEGLGQQPVFIQGKGLGNPGDGLAQQGGACTLGGAGAHLFAVQGGEEGNGPAGAGVQEALEAAPDAFQIIQRGAGQEALVQAPYAGLLADVEEQVVAQDFAPGLLFQHSCELPLVLGGGQQRQHIGDGIPLVAVVGLPVHVNGHVGDQQQVPVNVQQAAFGPVLGLHQHPAGNAQGPVQPGGQNLPAVALHGQPGVHALDLTVLFQLEGGAVRVGGADEKAQGFSLRHPEGQHGAATTVNIIFSAGNQLPFFGFLQGGIARLVQNGRQVGPGVILAVRSVQKGAEFFCLGKHSVFSLSLELSKLFYIGFPFPSMCAFLTTFCRLS